MDWSIIELDGVWDFDWLFETLEDDFYCWEIELLNDMFDFEFSVNELLETYWTPVVGFLLKLVLVVC